MHTHFTVITAQPDLPDKPHPLWQRLIVGTLLACTLLVQTGQVLAQYQNVGQNNAQNSGQPNTGYVAPPVSAPVSAPTSGYTPDGVLYMAGQRIGNPHQILHDAQIPAFMTITATQYTFTNNPSHGQGTLAQMETATTTGSDSSVLLNRLYLSPTNPYVQGAPGPANYQTYQGVLANAQQANYLLTNADDGKTYAFKTLTAASRQAVDLLIRELPNTPQFRAAADPLGGGTGVRVTQNGDAAALAAYLLTVKPYDYSWQPNFGNFSGQNNAAYSGWANSNNFAPDYSEGGGAPTSQAALIKQLQDTAVANDKRVRSQTSANSLDLNGVSPNSLFGEGYNLFAYGSNSNPNRDLENDFLRRLQSGQLEAGSADYLEASRIAQERYRIAYATRLETNKPLQYSVADSQRKANELQLGSINPNELFGQGFDLFQYNKALRANGEAENALLARLQAGELTPGTADYLQATQIAQERLRLAYSQSLVPPEPKKVSKWKLIAGVVAGAILTFVTAGAAAPFLGAALGIGATAASAVAGIVGSYVGAVVSTGITTGSLSQALRAGEKALVSGSIKAIVANAIGAGFISDIIGGAIATKVVSGGSFADALRGAVIGAAVNFVADGIGEKFAGAIKDAGLGAAGTELAHGALGCVTGMIRAQSGSGCAPGAAGAIAGHLVAPVIFGTGFDPLGTGTVQGVKDSAVFFSGVLGGAVAAAVGKDDQVNANFGLGSAAGSNAANNNALQYVARAPAALAALASGGWQALTTEAQAVLRMCAANSTCSTLMTAVPASVMAYLVTSKVATAPSAADQIPTGYPSAPPPNTGTPPSLVSTNNQLNNIGNTNSSVDMGPNNTGGNQIVSPTGVNTAGGGFGAGAQPVVGNGVVMSTVPPKTPDLASGSEPDRGDLTKSGRAQQKHGDRVDSAFDAATGTPQDKNTQGQSTLDGIMNSPKRIDKPNRYGGTDVYEIPGGRGARFGADGKFTGFLEP